MSEGGSSQLRPDDVLGDAAEAALGDPQWDGDDEHLIEPTPAIISLEEKFAHLKGLQDHYFHKGLWSWALIGVLVVLVLFQCWLLYKVGIKHWDFTDYEWLLPVLLVQNLAQIVGLATFAVRSLFKRLTPDRA